MFSGGVLLMPLTSKLPLQTGASHNRRRGYWSPYSLLLVIQLMGIDYWFASEHQCPFSLFQQQPMQIESANSQPTHQLLTNFLNSLGEDRGPSMRLLASIKSRILSNTHNYFHPLFGRVTYAEIYEFIVDSIVQDPSCYERAPKSPETAASQYHDSCSAQTMTKFLMHVLALMARHWINKPDDARELFDGLMSVVEQRPNCVKNCFLFLKAWIQEIQVENTEEQADGSCKGACPYENFFVYHILNEILALANIFLDKAVVRNIDRITNSIASPKKNTRIRVSDQFQVESSCVSLDEESNIQLYRILQPSSYISALLSTIHACLCYDFNHLSRSCQEDHHYVRYSQIILPTKFSKHCRFGEFDLFIKDENTNQLLNYLYLAGGLSDKGRASTGKMVKSRRKQEQDENQLRVCVLKVLSAMARVHFRYFKNKSYHRLHLENIAYILVNLFSGLDLEQRQPSPSKTTKVDVAVCLGEALNCLLYHQPTFYAVEATLIESVLQALQYFVLNALLSPEDRNINMHQFLLLLELFIAPLSQLKEMLVIHSRDSNILSQCLNEIIIRIGEHYEPHLHNLVGEQWDLSSFQAREVTTLLALFRIYIPKYDPVKRPSVNEKAYANYHFTSSDLSAVLSDDKITLQEQTQLQLKEKASTDNEKAESPNEEKTLDEENDEKRVKHWCLYWLSNFEYHFHKCGRLCHPRLMALWEEELSQSNILYLTLKQLLPLLLSNQPPSKHLCGMMDYLCDRLMNDCRVPPTEFLSQAMGLHPTIFLHFIVQRLKLKESEEKLRCICDLTDKWVREHDSYEVGRSYRKCQYSELSESETQVQRMKDSCWTALQQLLSQEDWAGSDYQMKGRLILNLVQLGLKQSLSQDSIWGNYHFLLHQKLPPLFELQPTNAHLASQLALLSEVLGLIHARMTSSYRPNDPLAQPLEAVYLHIKNCWLQGQPVINLFSTGGDYTAEVAESLMWIICWVAKVDRLIHMDNEYQYPLLMGFLPFFNCFLSREGASACEVTLNVGFELLKLCVSHKLLLKQFVPEYSYLLQGVRKLLQQDLGSQDLWKPYMELLRLCEHHYRDQILLQDGAIEKLVGNLLHPKRLSSKDEVEGLRYLTNSLLPLLPAALHSQQVSYPHTQQLQQTEANIARWTDDALKAVAGFLHAKTYDELYLQDESGCWQNQQFVSVERLICTIRTHEQVLCILLEHFPQFPSIIKSTCLEVCADAICCLPERGLKSIQHTLTYWGCQEAPFDQDNQTRHKQMQTDWAPDGDPTAQMHPQPQPQPDHHEPQSDVGDGNALDTESDSTTARALSHPGYEGLVSYTQRSLEQDVSQPLHKDEAQS